MGKIKERMMNNKLLGGDCLDNLADARELLGVADDVRMRKFVTSRIFRERR